MYRYKNGKEVPPFVEKTKIVVSLDTFYIYIFMKYYSSD
jgi:hypothetical protein